MSDAAPLHHHHHSPHMQGSYFTGRAWNFTRDMFWWKDVPGVQTLTDGSEYAGSLVSLVEHGDLGDDAE